ncbi:polymorphic toxin-type HINT domain-containing protein, partial [Acinetobacter pittii]|uniref:polymorphic toxin-type HINT domain-containing protein n=1 Tax=Acinetobacter pittii TaxID=48296 RepID=UPI002953DC21
FHSDHLTSIEVITDATGAVVERLSYDPWGKRRNADGTVASTVLKGTKDSHGFTSHEMLDSIGLVHMNGRVYDPQVGRFTSADPIIDGADNLQGYNRYSYVHNNPGTLLDPSGYSWLSKKWKSFTGFLKDAMVTVTDDWLGSCSGNQGNCGVTVGVTYGPNNQGYYSADNQNINQYNNGKMTIQPYVGFGGPKNYYFVNSSYQNGELNFNGVGYNSNGMVELVPEYRIHASYLSGFSQYLFNAAGTELGDFLTGMQRDQRQTIDENTPDQAEIVVEASLWTTTVGRFPSLGRVGSGISRTWNKLFKPCGCFDDDTPVLTKDGYKRIVEIKEGDLVLARHEETGEIAYKPVKRVFVVPNRRIYLLKTINSLGKENIIEVSDDHPFWVVDKKWVDSIELKEGDQLLDANNQVHKVVSITETDRVETTYNLEIEGYHTYFAGDVSIWVHNNNCFRYENAPYHGKVDNSIKSRAPINGQSALDLSIQVKATSPRRVGIDYAKKEFVVFDKTEGNVFHGHVRSWDKLHVDMQNVLKKAGFVDKKGRILEK